MNSGKSDSLGRLTGEFSNSSTRGQSVPFPKSLSARLAGISCMHYFGTTAPMTAPLETPVLFLIFNRPDTTKLVFEQIRKAAPKKLFIASDGPRAAVAGEKEKCEEARNIVNQIDWDCNVETLYREKNLGCGMAVSSAISWFFDRVTEGIILEDDCLPDLSFFFFCEELLQKYRTTDQVKLISGNNFQGGKIRGTGSYYFSHYPEIWGWASWRRVWKDYNFQLKNAEETAASAPFKNAYRTTAERKYWLEKFRLTEAGDADTWDYQLTYMIIQKEGVAISPQVNLVKNIGLNPNATHAALKDSSKELDINAINFPLIHPEFKVDKQADAYSFARIYGHTPERIFRLVRENGLMAFIRYFLKK